MMFIFYDMTHLVIMRHIFLYLDLEFVSKTFKLVWNNILFKRKRFRQISEV